MGTSPMSCFFRILPHSAAILAQGIGHHIRKGFRSQCTLDGHGCNYVEYGCKPKTAGVQKTTWRKVFCWWVSTFNATPFASHVDWGAGRKPLQSRLGQQKWAAGRTSALWPWGRPTSFAAGRRQGGRRYVVPLCSSWSVGNSTCRLARCFSGRTIELNQWPRTLWALRMWPRFFGRISSHFFILRSPSRRRFLAVLFWGHLLLLMFLAQFTASIECTS